jgi:hypothetical protein
MSIGMVALISAFVSNARADPILRHMGACLLIMCFSGIRYVQMQSFTLYGTRDGVVYGQVFRKTPERGHHTAPVPFWIVLCDLNSEERAPFFDMWLESVKDVLDILEAQGVPLTFTARSVTWGRDQEMVNGAMSYRQFNNHMWKVLVAACPGMTEALARTFTPHSCRTFLQNVFKGRKESKKARTLTGEWDGWASAQEIKSCIWSPDQIRQAAAKRLMNMPDRYATAQLAVDSIDAFDRNFKHLQLLGARRLPP